MNENGFRVPFRWFQIVNLSVLEDETKDYLMVQRKPTICCIRSHRRLQSSAVKGNKNSLCIYCFYSNFNDEKTQVKALTKSFEVNVLIGSQPQPRIIHTTSIIAHQHHLEYVSTNQGGIFWMWSKRFMKYFCIQKMFTS